MKKLLKIRFVKFERALAMQILEQKGDFPETKHICGITLPALCADTIYLRGVDKTSDLVVHVTPILDNNEERDQLLGNAIKWISEEQFSTKGELEIEGDVYTWGMEVSDER